MGVGLNENTNGLVWLQHERVYLQQSCIYFPISGRHNIFKKPRRLVTKLNTIKQLLHDGFPQTKLTHENMSTTEKEGKIYAYSNRVFTNKINPREFIQSKMSSPLAESL